jgi:adenylate kinase family enzyme
MKLPSRYEDLDTAYKGRIVPNLNLIKLIKKADKAIRISGGIRFIPIFGGSGSGKSCASVELSTHLPETHTFTLNPSEIEDKSKLFQRIVKEQKYNLGKILIPIIDQFEENVAGKESIPSQFIEFISLFDRNELKNIPTIFIWLTTSREFQSSLVVSTRRNKRILASSDFEVKGPDKSEWTKIINDTFSIHNNEKALSDYLIIDTDIEKIVFENDTIGGSIEMVGELLAEQIDDIQDLSEYMIVLFWPVSDSIRNQRVMQFSRPREGYKLDWDSFFRELSNDDKKLLPLDVYNRTRLYFDFRIIPFRVADMHRLFLDLDNDSFSLGKTYLTRFKNTHFFHILNNNWENYSYNPVRERESQRSIDAAEWYKGVTSQPTKVGKRLAKIIKETGFNASYEKEISTEFSTVKADVYVEKDSVQNKKLILELKVYAAENTMPSTIKEQIKVTLRRHALLAGFMTKN